MESRVADSRGRGGIPWRFIGWGGAVALILTPLVAMQFTSEVNLTLSDFIVMGALIGSIGLGFELAFRASGNAAYRAGAGLALLTAFLMTWSNLAVGIVGDGTSPVNMLFFAVVVMGIVGGYASRLTATGMTRTMLAVTAVQALISSLVIVAGERDGMYAAVFAMMMLLSAAFFRKAASDEEKAS